VPRQPLTWAVSRCIKYLEPFRPRSYYYWFMFTPPPNSRPCASSLWSGSRSAERSACARAGVHTRPVRNSGLVRASVLPVHSPASTVALAIALAIGLLAGCSYRAPSLPVSEGHLSAKTAAAPSGGGDVPAPVSVPPPPAPRPKPKLPTYSVVVNEVPVKELLFALARDTRQNIDVHPGITGVVSLNAIDETLPAILDRISRQANLRWKQDGRSISVQADTPYISTYKVNYVNVVRNTDSTVGVSGIIATVGAGGGGGGGGGAASKKLYVSVSSTLWLRKRVSTGRPLVVNMPTSVTFR